MSTFNRGEKPIMDISEEKLLKESKLILDAIIKQSPWFVKKLIHVFSGETKMVVSGLLINNEMHDNDEVVSSNDKDNILVTTNTNINEASDMNLSLIHI